jgi:aspartokinase-like uncharacterized kinase
MTCAEFQRILIVEELTDLENHEHPGSCATCRDLVADLRAIAVAVRFLRSADPAEHVWHRISQTLGLASGEATLTHPDMPSCVLESAQR